MDFDQFDDDQVEVLRWSPDQSNLRVIAAAGSGKTLTIVGLVSKLLLVDQLEPEDICVLSFANKAAAELRARLAGAVGQAKANRMTVGTFHSVGLQVLRNFDESAWNMSKCMDLPQPPRASDVPSALEVWRSAVVFGEMPGTGAKSLQVAEGPEHHRFAVSLQRADGKTYKEAVKSSMAAALPRAWALVEASKATFGGWEFDDVLLEWDAVLARKGYIPRAKVIIVDEAQDNNRVQCSIVRRLASQGGRIVLVGDLRQTIHAWRGAYTELLRGLDKREEVKTLNLRFNYRSQPGIVELCNAYADHHRLGLGESVVATRKRESARPTITIARPAPTMWVEALRAAGELKKHLEASPQGTSAILCRTNGQVAVFEMAFASMGIPVKLLPSRSAISGHSSRALINYLRAIHHKDVKSLVAVLNTPKRYLPRTFGQRLLTSPCPERRSLSHHVRDVAFGANMKKGSLKGALQLADFLAELADSGWREQVSQIRSLLLAGLDDVGEVHEVDTIGLLQALVHVALSCSSYEEFEKMVLASEKPRDPNSGPAVVLSTIHQAKGLEWDRVYVDVTDGYLPHRRSEGEGLREEARLLYVAMSRARDELVLIFNEESSKRDEDALSSLLVPILRSCRLDDLQDFSGYTGQNEDDERPDPSDGDSCFVL